MARKGGSNRHQYHRGFKMSYLHVHSLFEFVPFIKYVRQQHWGLGHSQSISYRSYRYHINLNLNETEETLDARMEYHL